jgi:hypothetical protein
VAGELLRLPDEALAERRANALERLSPRARVAALAVHAGKSGKQAAREAGLSTGASAVSRMLTRLEPALALLREEARRAAHETVQTAAAFLGELAEEAREAKDFGAAVRAKSEQAKLLDLYPDPRLRVEAVSVQVGTVTPEEWAALATLRHEVRRALPAASPSTPAPCLMTEGVARPQEGLSPLANVHPSFQLGEPKDSEKDSEPSP